MPGGRLVMPGSVTVGAFVAFGVYLAMLVWPMIALGWAVNLVQRGAASMGRDQPALPGAARRSRSRSVPPRSRPLARRPRASSSGACRSAYPGAHATGARCCRTSPSGSTRAGRSRSWGPRGRASPRWWICSSGPTTRTAGAVLLDGVDIRRLPLAELRRAIGFVPQETFLFSDTLRENVLLGAPDDGRLERVAEVAQLTEALPALPARLRHDAGRARDQPLAAGRSSGAAIARALAQDPPIFVLDDALSAVDAQTEAKILRALRGALAGRTSIIVSHRLAAVRDADWILVLDDGRIVEQGTHADLIARGGRYWELLRRQQLEEELEEEAVATTPSG